MRKNNEPRIFHSVSIFNYVFNFYASWSSSFYVKGLNVTFGEEHINIQRKDGVHCEFYGQLEPSFGVYFATYTIDGNDTDLYFYLPEDLNIFVETVEKILKF